MSRRKPNPQSPSLVDRRALLVASATLAAPLAVPKLTETLSAPQQTEKSCEYQETEHIREFYRTCRF